MTNRATDRRQTLKAGTFLSRLRKDKAGNTLMLVTAAIIPLVGFIGAGVDISRTYMIKSRLQQACDAGALATRKSMGGATSISTTAAANGQAFFANNFPTGAFGTSNIAFAAGLSADSQVAATASARVPVTIMQVFGNDHTDISVRCDARLEIANTDIMFVLDVTGSMADCPNGSNCNSNASSKIAGLRQAVLDFYDTLDGSSSADAQLRFGFVPYSANVNVGSILPSAYFNDSHVYQSAVANMTTPYYEPTPRQPVISTETYGSSLSSTNCNTYGINKSYPTLDGKTFNSGGPAPTPTVQTTYSFKDWGAVSDTSGTTRTCRRNKTVVTTDYPLVGYKLTDWSFQQSTYDVSGFKGGSSVPIVTGDPTGYVADSGSYNLQELAAEPNATAPQSSYTWNGCIEERDTEDQSTFSPIPSTAYDLMIDLVPNSQETRWRTAFRQIIRMRGGIPNETSDNLNDRGIPSAACPRASRKLATMERAEVSSYVNGLIATGSTYHDIGMVWGARLISPTGLFASENATAPNGKPIRRHIIFMTDGDMCPNPDTYTFHGLEKLDRRVMGSTTPDSCTGEIVTRHNNRFLALCTAAKGMNISVWTVAFGTSNPSTLINCANANQAFVATDTAALRLQFAQIAARIASLRLSK